MPNHYFRFKEFIIYQDNSSMKVCTDSCLFAAWVANKIEQRKIIPESVLDIGTGTGLLALMLAQKTGAAIDAIEIEKNAFEQADANFKASPWSERLQAIHGDIKNWRGSRKYDLIISNPPFYENDLLPEDRGKNMSKHNATLNLEGLLLAVTNLMSAKGSFAVLLPWSRTHVFETIASEQKLFTIEKTEVKQTSSHDFFRSMLVLQKRKDFGIKNAISIKNNKNGYTKEFSELLKDYYLYL